jgi:hypothetical protein
MTYHLIGRRSIALIKIAKNGAICLDCGVSGRALRGGSLCLADASAVQFIRTPQGVAGALKNISSLSQGSTLQAIHAPKFSHLNFCMDVNAFL